MGKFAIGALLCALVAGCSTPDPVLRIMRDHQQEQLALQSGGTPNDVTVSTEEQVHLSFIRQLLQEGRHFAALAHIDDWERRHGASQEVRLLRANTLRLTGQNQESEAGYRQLLDGPHAASAWHGLGLLAASRGDYTAAAESMARAASLDPVNATILSDLGYARLRARDIEGARVPIAQAAELAPDNAKILANLALLLAASGDTAAAESVMQTSGMNAAARDAVRTLGAQLLVASQNSASDPEHDMAPGLEPVAAGMQNRPEWQLPQQTHGVLQPLLNRLGRDTTTP